jgi:histidinol-phosphate/aromatic aminotransferase/cobyric acid decarboxylase-like protein
MTTTFPTQPGLDTFPSYVPGDLAEALCQADFVRLAANENPLGPSPKVVAVLVGTLSTLNRYPDAEAHALRQTLARRLAVRPDRIQVGKASWHSDYCAGMPAVADVMLPENGKKTSRIAPSRG